MTNKDPKRNPSGCLDLTAYEAIKNADLDRLKNELLKDIFDACERYGFCILGRLTLKHKKSGRIWR